MGTLGFTVFNALMYAAAHHTSAVNLTILQGSVPVLVLLGALGYYGLHVWEWLLRHFIVSTRRVLLTSGIIVRTVTLLPLRRITDLTWQETLLGNLLGSVGLRGYGTFRFESAGQDQALREIKHLPNPNELYLRVVEEMYEPQAVEARLGKDGDAGDDA